MTYQIKPLGLVSTNLATKHFFEILGPEKAQRGGGGGLEMISSKNCFSTPIARFAQGKLNVIFHIYFINYSEPCVIFIQGEFKTATVVA